MMPGQEEGIGDRLDPGLGPVGAEIVAGLVLEFVEAFFEAARASVMVNIGLTPVMIGEMVEDGFDGGPAGVVPPGGSDGSKPVFQGQTSSLPRGPCLSP